MSFTIAVLVGTARPGRQGIKVANCVASKLRAKGHTVHLIDPVEYKAVQTFVERYRYLKEPHEDLVKISKLLTSSDGFVAVTPEYNYMYSPQIKIFLDTYYNEFKFKPMGMVSYSMGSFAGIRAIEHLRATSNVLGMVPVPTTAVFPTVHEQFDETSGELKNERLDKSLDTMLKEFEWYVQALSNQRKLDPSILPQ